MKHVHFRLLVESFPKILNFCRRVLGLPTFLSDEENHTEFYLEGTSFPLAPRKIISDIQQVLSFFGYLTNKKCHLDLFQLPPKFPIFKGFAVVHGFSQNAGTPSSEGAMLVFSVTDVDSVF
ncbi:MAG: hypothetical protein U0Z75_04925 [Deinococcaceae bacterium]